MSHFLISDLFFEMRPFETLLKDIMTTAFLSSCYCDALNVFYCLYCILVCFSSFLVNKISDMFYTESLHTSF